jgi:hypothetical protein
VTEDARLTEKRTKIMTLKKTLRPRDIRLLIDGSDNHRGKFSSEGLRRIVEYYEGLEGDQEYDTEQLVQDWSEYASEEIQNIKELKKERQRVFDLDNGNYLVLN